MLWWMGFDMNFVCYTATGTKSTSWWSTLMHGNGQGINFYICFASRTSV